MSREATPVAVQLIKHGRALLARLGGWRARSARRAAWRELRSYRRCRLGDLSQHSGTRVTVRGRVQAHRGPTALIVDDDNRQVQVVQGPFPVFLDALGEADLFAGFDVDDDVTVLGRVREVAVPDLYRHVSLTYSLDADLVTGSALFSAPLWTAARPLFRHAARLTAIVALLALFLGIPAVFLIGGARRITSQERAAALRLMGVARERANASELLRQRALSRAAGVIVPRPDLGPCPPSTVHAVQRRLSQIGRRPGAIGFQRSRSAFVSLGFLHRRLNEELQHLAVQLHLQHRDPYAGQRLLGVAANLAATPGRDWDYELTVAAKSSPGPLNATVYVWSFAKKDIVCAAELAYPDLAQRDAALRAVVPELVVAGERVTAPPTDLELELLNSPSLPLASSSD